MSVLFNIFSKLKNQSCIASPDLTDVRSVDISMAEAQSWLSFLNN